MKITASQWPELSTLIDRMLDVPMAEREAWVRALRGAEAALAPQLLQLLKGAEDAQTARTSPWLDTLPKLDDPVLYTVTPTGPGSGFEQPGEEIGPYRLVRLLGRGGMGSVWYAERSDKLVKRGVALKLPLGAGKQLAARFEREREIVASLAHPHIARLYDAGITASGQAYLALEYVEGQNLDDYCDQRCLGLRARVQIFAQVLGAVQYAHSRLVIHRDLKPSNILISTEGYVRLLDFGVAKMLDTENGEASELTRLGDAGMTLAYASPEQVGGGPVSTASDIYSLGVVLYELLVGARPYRLKRDSRGAVEDAILQADIPLPSGRVISEEAAAARGSTPKKLARELRGDLDAIVLKALSKQAADRYATASAFADDLFRYADGRPVRAVRASRWYGFNKFVGRNRYAVGGASLAAVALIIAAGIAFWQAREANRQAQIAATERDRALAAVAHREAVDDFMSDLLLDAGLTGKPILVPALIARADELSMKEFANIPEARATVLKTVADFDNDFVGPEKALADLDYAQGLLVNSRDIGLRVNISCARALLRGTMGYAEEAEATLKKAIDDPHSSVSEVIGCLQDRANLAIYRHDGSAARPAVAQALALWESSAQHSPTAHLRLLLLDAEAKNLNGEPAKADAEYAQIIEALRKSGRDRGPLGSIVRKFRLTAAIDSGDPILALQIFDESSAILKQDAPDQPLPAYYQFGRCLALARLGRTAEAMACFKSTEIQRDTTLAQGALLNSAMLLSEAGRQSEAEELYATATGGSGPKQKEEGGGAFHALRVLARAQLDLASGRPKLAKNGLESYFNGKSQSKLYHLFEFRKLRALANLADHRVEDARMDAQLALESARRMRGDKPYSLFVGEASFILGNVMNAQGDRTAARQLYEDSVEQLSHTVDSRNSHLIAARDRLRVAL